MRPRLRSCTRRAPGGLAVLRPPATATPRAPLPDDVAGSLDLLRELGGIAYCGLADDRSRHTVWLGAASWLEAEGLADVVMLDTFVLVVLRGALT